MKKIISLSLFVTLVFVYVISCKKKETINKSENLSELTISVFGTKLSIINLSKNALNTSDEFSGGTGNLHPGGNNGTGTLHTFFSDLSKTNLNSFLTTVKSNLSNGAILPSDLDQVIMFTKEIDICENYDSLTAIATFKYLTTNKIQFNFFRVINKVVSEISYYNVQTDYTAIVNINTLAKIYNNKTYLCFSIPPSTAQDQNLNNKTDLLAKAIIDNNSKVIEGEAGCALCAGMPGYCVFSPGFRYCQIDGCTAKAINEKGLANGALTNATKLNMNLAYTYKDGIMSQTDLGKKYISYYYKISYFREAYNSITTSNFSLHLSLANDVYDICNKMTNGGSNDIIITTAFKNKANLLITEYQNLSQNLELQAILIDIKNDLTNFEGKTKSQVQAEIQ